MQNLVQMNESKCAKDILKCPNEKLRPNKPEMTDSVILPLNFVQISSCHISYFLFHNWLNKFSHLYRYR